MISGGDYLVVFEHGWSLAVEEHSYLLLAGLALLTARSAAAAMRLAVLLAVAAMANGLWQSWAAPETIGIYGRSDVRAASILTSFALCLWLYGRALPPAVLGWAAPFALAGGLAIGVGTGNEMLLCTAGTALLAIGVNLIDNSAAAVRKLLEEPVLRWFGLVSFSLYLWQQPSYAAGLQGAPWLHALGFALLCGCLSYYAVERPARRYLNARVTAPARPLPAC